MKTLFSRCWLCLLATDAQQAGPAAKPAWATIYNNKLSDAMTAELTVKKLRAVYGSSFRVGKISKNEYEPTVRDTLFVVNTAADKLSVFKK